MAAQWEVIDWCPRNPLEHQPLAADDPRMTALLAYIAYERRGAKLEPGKHRWHRPGNRAELSPTVSVGTSHSRPTFDIRCSLLGVPSMAEIGLRLRKMVGVLWGWRTLFMTDECLCLHSRIAP